MNIPNVLTILRMVLVPTYIYMLYSHHIPYANMWASLLFCVAALTDLLDGHIARRYKLITDFGKIMDPVADKIMVTAAMVVLVDLHRLAAWIVIVMLFRDFAVGALRDVAASRGTIIAAGIWGKLKTALQMVSIALIIWYNNITIWPLSAVGLTGDRLHIAGAEVVLPVYPLGMLVMYLALLASVFSGITYFRQYVKVFKP